MLTIDELNAARLSVEDFDPDWRKASMTSSEQLHWAENGFCPAGGPLGEPTQATGIGFRASGDIAVGEWLYQYSDAVKPEHPLAAIEACVGEVWEVGYDPIDYYTVKRIELPEFGDATRGYVVQASHAFEDGPAHADGLAVVKVADVSLFLMVTNAEVAEPFDTSLLEEFLPKAVARLESIIDNPGAALPSTDSASPTTPASTTKGPTTTRPAPTTSTTAARSLPTMPPTSLPAYELVELESLIVGRCLYGTELIYDLYLDDVLKVVDCAQPHHAEVFHVSRLDDATGAPYPGDDAAENSALARCSPSFDQYVGRAWADSRFDFTYVYPSQPEWDANDRLILCYLFDVSGRTLTGSMAGIDE